MKKLRALTLIAAALIALGLVWIYRQYAEQSTKEDTAAQSKPTTTANPAP